MLGEGERVGLCVESLCWGVRCVFVGWEVGVCGVGSVVRGACFE